MNVKHNYFYIKGFVYIFDECAVWDIAEALRL